MKFKQGSLDLARGAGGRASRFRAGVVCAGIMSVALFCGFGYFVIKARYADSRRISPPAKHT
jgi:hypothetical protein